MRFATRVSRSWMGLGVILFLLPCVAFAQEGYGSRAELYLTGFGVVGSQANGNSITRQETDAAGLSVGYRFHLNSSSALDGRYGFSRNSDKYTINGAVSSIPSYFSEVSGSYVYTFHKSRRILPFVEGGGGALIFIPGNYSTPGSAAAGGVGGIAGGTPADSLTGYVVRALHGEDVAAPVYSGSSAGVATQVRGMFVYGAGVDFPAFKHWYLRAEFRGLGYKAPDFKLSPLATNAFAFTYEPSLGIAYRF